ncbi:hypothetical protein [Cruoricaptor ignavus]|uniref:hypothetical protein n=1 Tax=Cruoricaptor ignavus TaxID=1118202 RepID=UPI0009340AA4|nr:hypothetical protein [Cruoricaptor ignavus]
MKANLIERLKEPTPKFFKRLRNIGLGLTAAGSVVLSAEIGLPALIVKIAGYLAVAGGIASAVSQAAVYEDE